MSVADVYVLNGLLGMPTSFVTKPHEGAADAPFYFLDLNYIDCTKTATCLQALASARAARRLDFSTKALILSVKGRHPLGEELFALLGEFREHDVFFELWNGLREVVELSKARIENLYFLPVTCQLTHVEARSFAESPNPHVFVSLGGDDDLTLVEEVIGRCPELHFSVPSVSWDESGAEKRFIDVRMEGKNVTMVDCSVVHRTGQPTFSRAYRAAFDACDTVLLATTADKLFQMRGGVRFSDALQARKYIVVTESPMLELLIAMHERRCLVATHDPEAIAAHLTRILQGAVPIDAPTYEAIRRLTVDEAKLTWMIGAAKDPEAAKRSPFARGKGLLETARFSLMGRGRALLDREVEGLRKVAGGRLRPE